MRRTPHSSGSSHTHFLIQIEATSSRGLVGHVDIMPPRSVESGLEDGLRRDSCTRHLALKKLYLLPNKARSSPLHHVYKHGADLLFCVHHTGLYDLLAPVLNSTRICMACWLHTIDACLCPYERGAKSTLVAQLSLCSLLGQARAPQAALPNPTPAPPSTPSALALTPPGCAAAAGAGAGALPLLPPRSTPPSVRLGFACANASPISG